MKTSAAAGIQNRFALLYMDGDRLRYEIEMARGEKPRAALKLRTQIAAARRRNGARLT